MIIFFAVCCLIIFVLIQCYCLETKNKNDVIISREFQELGIGGTLLSRGSVDLDVEEENLAKKQYVKTQSDDDQE